MRSGILVVHKPQNLTSRQVVNSVGKIFHTRKVGHTGTLDPLAEGVLVLGINQGTKVIDLLMETEKEYVAEVVIGQDSDTLDVTGKIVKFQIDHSYKKEEIIRVLESFIGTYDQEVPLYSAVHVDGKRLYEYARGNQEVSLPTRKVTIREIELLGDIKRNEDSMTFQFRVVVSKGTYIRSLIRDIGRKIGCPCIMKNLIRTKQGVFSLEQSHCLETLTENTPLLKIEEALQMMREYDTVVVSKDIETKVRNGAVLTKNFQGKYGILLNEQKELLAIYQEYEKNPILMKPWKVFPKEEPNEKTK